MDVSDPCQASRPGTRPTWSKVIVSVVDITQQKRAEDRLRFLSTHDVLTGLYNRAFFEEETTRMERGRHYPISVLMVDVDHLKITNDRRGHAAGDSLLRRAAAVLRAAFRTEDVVARIGGDEFAVLLPEWMPQRRTRPGPGEGCPGRSQPRPGRHAAFSVDGGGHGGEGLGWQRR